MRWRVHGERPIYESEWLRLVLTDVEIPGGERFEHHVVRVPNQAAGTVVRDEQRGVLLLWRHRFITDTWGYEIPAGRIEPGETAEAAAARETHRGDGLGGRATCRPRALSAHQRPLRPGLLHLRGRRRARTSASPRTRAEAERIEWVPVARLRRLLQDEQVLDGMSLTALCYALAFGVLQ